MKYNRIEQGNPCPIASAPLPREQQDSSTLNRVCFALTLNMVASAQELVDWLALCWPEFIDLNQCFSGLGKIVIDGDALVQYLISLHHTAAPKNALNLPEFQPLFVMWKLESFLNNLFVINNEEVSVVFFAANLALYADAPNWHLIVRQLVIGHVRSVLAKKRVITVRNYANWWNDEEWKIFVRKERISFVLAGDSEYVEAICNFATESPESSSELTKKKCAMVLLFAHYLNEIGQCVAFFNTCLSFNTNKIEAFVLNPSLESSEKLSFGNLEEKVFGEVASDFCSTVKSPNASPLEQNFVASKVIPSLNAAHLTHGALLKEVLEATVRLQRSQSLRSRCFDFEQILSVLAQNADFVEELREFAQMLIDQVKTEICCQSFFTHEMPLLFIDVVDLRLFYRVACFYVMNEEVCSWAIAAQESSEDGVPPYNFIINDNLFSRFLQKDAALDALECIDYEAAVEHQLVKIPFENCDFWNDYVRQFPHFVLIKEEEPTEKQRAMSEEKRRFRAMRAMQKHAAFITKYAESLDGSKGLHHVIVSASANSTVRDAAAAASSSASSIKSASSSVIAATVAKEGKKPPTITKAQKIIEENKMRLHREQLEKDTKNLDTLIGYMQQLKTTTEQLSYIESINLNNFSFELRWKIYAEKLDLLCYAWKEHSYDLENGRIKKLDYDHLTRILYFCIDFVMLFGLVAPIDVIKDKPLFAMASYAFKPIANALIERVWGGASTAASAVIPKLKEFVASVTPIRKLANPQTSIRFQLMHGGPYFPRTLDSKPDPRVRFSPDAWQVELLDIVDRNESAFICAPTSSGKTFISYYAMEKVLRTSDEDVVVFVAPTKPLITQVQAEIHARFHSKTYAANSGMVLCGVIAKDFEENPFNCQILVTLPQILQSLLESPELKERWTHKVKYVVLDEIHMINEEDFGSSWERIILALDCPVLSMSATIENRVPFFEWMRSVQAIKNIPCHLIQHFERYSDLKKFFYIPPRLNDTISPHELTSLSKPLTTSSSAIAATSSANGPRALVDIHPLAAISFEDIRNKGITEDLVFLPEESFQLYESINALFAAKKPTDALNPDVFFDSGQLLSKRDARAYEKVLKAYLIDVIQSGAITSQEFDALKRRICGDYHAAVHTLDVALNFHSAAASSKTFLKRHFIQLLVDMKAAKKLPALFFYVDRREFCNELAIDLLEFLKNAEKEKAKITDKSERLKMAAAEAAIKATKKARETAKVTRDSWIDDAIQNEDLQSLMIDADEVDADFSFVEPRFKLLRKELNDIIAELKWKMQPEQMPLLDALRRGIGVHHTGLPRKYLSQVEYLFRKRHLQVVISSATLALGINMPCKSAVFVGDYTQLNSVQFRQMSGRAGRRGFDDIGNVVFYGMPASKISKLLSSRMPRIVGRAPFTPNQLLALTAGAVEDPATNGGISRSARSFLAAGDATMRHPLFSIDCADEYDFRWTAYVMRWIVDGWMRDCILNYRGHPAILSRLALCVEEDARTFAFVRLLADGLLDDVCRIAPDVFGRDIDSVCISLLSVCAHVFQVKRLPPAIAAAFTEARSRLPAVVESRHRSAVVLPEAPAAITQALVMHNCTVIDAARCCVAHFRRDKNFSPATDAFAISGVNAEAFIVEKSRHDTEHSADSLDVQVGRWIAESAVSTQNLTCALFAALMQAPSPCGSSRPQSDVHAFVADCAPAFRPSVESLPCFDVPVAATATCLLNAYLLDFYKHEDRDTICIQNGISEAELWRRCDAFNRTLKFICAFLQANAPLFARDTVAVFSILQERFNVKFQSLCA